MANKEIRCALISYGFKQYQLAEELGIAEATLSRKLRKELTPEERDRVLAAIDRLARGE